MHVGIGPDTLVFDSEEGNAPYFLGQPLLPFSPTPSLGLRIDDAWWLTDIEGDPIYDETGEIRQIARFEIGEDCRYRRTPDMTPRTISKHWEMSED